MRVSTAVTVAASVALTHAFKDTSPFIYLSSSPASSIPSPNDQPQLQSVDSVLPPVLDHLRSCPTDNYILVSQAGISVSDLTPSSSSDVAGHLRHITSDVRWQTKVSVSEVVGLTDSVIDQVAANIRSSCEGMQKSVTTKEYRYEERPAEREARSVMLMYDDIEAFNSLRDAAGESYTIVYLTTPPTKEAAAEDATTYDAMFNSPLKMDLKRDLGIRDDNSTKRDNRPLFEKYQYLTPGLFMGLTVSFILLAILGVGLAALGSLEVSYGAFEKEMGPAAQRKQQ
ncbi:BIG/ATPase V1 complex, subunit S1 [Xylogone sp. PMI_703]|nr:BIG/ATPase V1 complex, subunit S1 [Xylogone sp. PMI_703]